MHQQVLQLVEILDLNSEHLKKRKAAFIRNWISMQDPLQTMIDDQQLLGLSNFLFSWIKHWIIPTYFVDPILSSRTPQPHIRNREVGMIRLSRNTWALPWQQAQGRHTTKAHKAHPIPSHQPKSPQCGGERQPNTTYMGCLQKDVCLREKNRFRLRKS